MKIALTVFLFCYAFLAQAQIIGKIKAIVLQTPDHHDVGFQGEVFDQILSGTGLFDVEVKIVDREDWKNTDLLFSDYDLIVSSNLGGDWPESLKLQFERYLFEGGNFVLVHQGVGSHQDWPEFHEMIGIGWYKWDAGMHLFWDDEESNWIKTPLYHGVGPGHGKQHEFEIKIRNKEHPITRGMPIEWMHGMDELYHGLRGPLKNIDILATAYSDKQTWGSGDHEPIAWTVNYGQGRVFVTVLGHVFEKGNAMHIPGINSYENETRAVHCVGFQTLIARGAEWAATGKVTMGITAEFPTKIAAISIPPNEVNRDK